MQIMLNNLENTNNITLVSIIIITYNSSNSIIETLESIKCQTYSKIELIISDDYSTDETLAICEKWLTSNKRNFVEYKLIKATTNTGIAANCNRGINACKGEWVKLIAGDDLLLPKCIEDNIEYTKKNKNAKIIISNMIVFLDNTEPKKIIETRRPLNEHIWNQSVSVTKQYDTNLLEYFGNSPSYFINLKVYEIIKFDENLPLIEDYPFSLNALKSGFKIDYFDTNTVMYRMREDSTSKANNNVLYNSFYLKVREFDTLYRIPFLSKKRKKMENFEFKRKLYLIKYDFNHNNFLCRLINSITIRLNPYRY